MTGPPWPTWSGNEARLLTNYPRFCPHGLELMGTTELTVQGVRFSRSGRLKRSETLGRPPGMPDNVIAMLIQPQKRAKTRPKGRRPPPFLRSCHLLGHPRAQLLRGCGSQHVPASQLVPDHTKHASPSTHSQSPQTQAVLQTAVGRLDPRPHRVPFLEDIGLLFPTPRGQTALLVGVLQEVASLVGIDDRALVAELTCGAGTGGHFELGLAGLLIPCAREGLMPCGTGPNDTCPLVDGEVIDREGFGVAFRSTARDRPDQVHAELSGGLHVLIVCIERVAEHCLR